MRPYCLPVDSSQLRDTMAGIFRAAGAPTPPWPDPRPDGRQPTDEELESCKDPGKFRIVAARAEAWAAALEKLGLADLERIEDAEALWRELPWHGLSERMIRVRPRRADAVPLLIGFRSLENEPDAVVALGAGEPAVLVSNHPECACDACDNGSRPLLEEFDDNILSVVTGRLVHVQLPTFVAVSTLRGTVLEGEVTGVSNSRFEDLFAEVRAGRSELPAVYGPRWW